MTEISKTELVWPGKRTEVERVELPFQIVEVINLPRGRRQENLFESSIKQKKLIETDTKQPSLSSQDTEWKNRLIWGDNLLVMGSLLKEFAGNINLIYIDPPFATGDDFSFEVQIGEQEITKDPSALEVKAYRDTWGKGMQSYLQMMHDRLVLMNELLADDGSIYVHLDWHVGAYVRILMDEIFGKDNFLNEIAWAYRRWNIASNVFARSHDVLLFYRKGESYTFNNLYIPKSEKSSGKGKAWQSITDPETGRRKSVLLDVESKGTPMPDWWDVSVINPVGSERTGYSTQKPEALLERVIKASSNEGDMVADFFCGSGTTGAVAEKLGRRWIMSDLGRFAIHTTRKRLLDIGSKPFVIQNLGKYERHRWVSANGTYKDYINFILELYHAEPVDGFTLLHGKKDQTFVHVGAVDAPVTLSEIQETLKECKENKIKSLDVLGWEWEMGLHDLVKDEGARFGTKLSTRQIPREVMELNVKDKKIKEEIKFFELAYLEVKPKVDGKRVALELKNFLVPNYEELPAEVRDKVTSWSDFIDYWSVDWMLNQHEEETEEDDTFHNMNQRYRTRKDPKLELSMDYEYKKSGKYNILVKVIDIFGNDTTKLVEVKV